MKFTTLKATGMAAVLAAAIATAAYAGGLFQGFPILGSATFCGSTNSQTTSNTTPGVLPSSVCTTNVPAGPTTLLGSEVIPMDTGTAQGAAPQTILAPVIDFTNGFGGTTIATTNGTTALVTVKDAISTFIFAGSSTATYTNITLPPNPVQNQKFCLVNAGAGVLTLTAVSVGTSGQVFVGTAPTSIPVATAVGTAGTVTLSANCWLYNVSNTTWYRVL